MSIGRKHGTVIMGLVGLIAITATACGSENTSSSTERTRIDIRIKTGKVMGGVETVSISKGDDVKISLSSDEAQTVHLHGYDIRKDIPAGEEAVINFNANATGRFRLTSHQSLGEVDNARSSHMSGASNSSKHDEHEEQEKILVTIEVRP